MSRSIRVLAALPLLALGVLLHGSALAAPSASIEQVRNGQASSPTTPIPSWGTGNAGASNSHYLESHSIAYRTLMDGLPTDGTVVEITIGYAPRQSGSYAIDYLTQYQRLLPHVTFAHRDPEVIDPLDGITGVAPGVSTSPIPLPTNSVMIDPDGAGPEPAAPQPLTSMQSLPDSQRVMTLFGGTILDVEWVSQGDVSLTTKTSASQVKVRFIPNGPRAVLAWGGHIACRWDWGFNADGTPRSAAGISGSSYHMSLVGWNLGSLGSQDRSMSTDAVFPVPTCAITPLGPFCAGSTNTHSTPLGMESYLWSFLDNTCGAVIVGSDTSASVVVQTSGPGSYTLQVTTGASGFTKSCQTTVTVNAPAVADAGADLDVCAANPQVQLAGFVSGGNPSWTGGTGTFTPGRNVVNPLYTPSAAEIAAGSVTLTLTSTPAAGPCPAASAQVKIVIHPTAITNAGLDQTVCAGNPQVQLAGTLGGGASSATWSGGTGTFNPNASTLNAIYTPSAAEIAAGTVTLTLTTNDPAGPCGPATDQMVITINPSAVANAGLDQTVCASAPQVQLAGVLSGGATSGTWSGGSGSYNPNASALNAIYTPSAAEIAAGGVTLTLTTNDPAGPCGAGSDQMHITIQPAAVANAGANQTVCANAPQVQLAGVISGSATSGTWTGGTGTFNPNASTLNAIYTPSASEIAAGGVTLTLTTDDPAGPCGAGSGQMKITINPAAIANAGADLTVCAGAPQVQLAGSVSGGATSGTWSGGAGTYNPNASALNAIYTPSAAEIAAGGVTLTLTTNDPAGPCGPGTSQVHISIQPVATANAGPNQTVCSSSPQVQLAGSVGGSASGGTWTGGSGTFNPNASTLNAVYTPSAAEIAAGGVTLTLVSNDPAGPCGSGSGQMRITINPAAQVNAGPDQIVCASSPQVQLAGTIGGGATGGTWSGGAGTFSPKNTTLNAIYTPSAAEIAAGHVTLTLTASTTGPCPPMSDQVTITIDPVEVVNAGPDQAVCASSPQVQLAGSITGAVTTGAWTGGTGTFNPSRNALNAIYTPSPAEIAAGKVTLTLTSTSAGGPCPPMSDQMTITIGVAAIVNAGPDQIVCAASPVIQLAGSIGGSATSATWSGGAGTFAPNANALNATYTPTAGEVAAGSITLTLTTNDPAGPCPPVSDQVKITFDKPTVTVPNVVTCMGISPVTLCANPGNGVPPYTYHWSNGATTQCIQVSDTLLYTVTVTDSKGCQATGSGRFQARDCVGQLTHTSATCNTFEAGTSEDFPSSDVSYHVDSNNIITTIAPGVFFYWSKVTAPSTDFTIDIAETKSDPNFPFIPIQQGNQVQLYDANCNTLVSGTEVSPGQGQIVVHGAVVGQVFILSVKYSLKDVVGAYLNPNTGVHFDFRTWINGQLVDADPDGLTLGNASVVGVGTPGHFVRLFHPMPNPFTGYTQMSYAVQGDQEQVSIKIYDVAGRMVRTLVDAPQAAGVYSVTWNGRDEQGTTLRPGMYFVMAKIGSEAQKVRVTFLK
jgi:hypothetical protein